MDSNYELYSFVATGNPPFNLSYVYQYKHVLKKMDPDDLEDVQENGYGYLMPSKRLLDTRMIIFTELIVLNLCYDKFDILDNSESAQYAFGYDSGDSSFLLYLNMRIDLFLGKDKQEVIHYKVCSQNGKYYFRYNNDSYEGCVEPEKSVRASYLMGNNLFIFTDEYLLLFDPANVNSVVSKYEFHELVNCDPSVNPTVQQNGKI